MTTELWHPQPDQSRSQREHRQDEVWGRERHRRWDLESHRQHYDLGQCPRHPERNTATGGRGIYNEFGATTILANVTVDGNRTGADHGGAGLFNAGTATLTDVTVSGNAAVDGGGIFPCGGGAPRCMSALGSVLTIMTSVTIGGNASMGVGGLVSANEPRRG